MTDQQVAPAPPEEKKEHPALRPQERGQRRPVAAPPSLPDDARDSELIRAAATDRLPDDRVQDALDVFMRAEGDNPTEPQPLKINLGTKDEPNYVKWVVAPIDDSEIQRFREQSRTKGSRAARRRGEGDVDEGLVARKIVARGTVEPDMGKLREKVGAADPADAVYAYFRKFGKTGLITKISGEILTLSGWDDEAVQEMEVEAAKG